MSTYTDSINRSHRLHHNLPPTVLSPVVWLRAGLQDMITAPVTSAALGVAFTALCALAYVTASNMPILSATVVVTLLLTGPFLAAAAYHVPRQRENGRSPGAHACINGVRRRALGVGLFAIACALIVAAWTRLSSIAFALYYGSTASGPEIARIWTSGQYSLSMLVFLIAASVILASVLFGVSSVSLPMIADRNTDVVTAMRTSIRTLRVHKLTLGLWVLIIVALTAAALFSKLILMPLVFPLLAYATWHSYRQLVHEDS